VTKSPGRSIIDGVPVESASLLKTGVQDVHTALYVFYNSSDNNTRFIYDILSIYTILIIYLVVIYLFFLVSP